MQCPSCSQPFQITPEMAGQVVECPGCGSAVAIPEIQPETATNPDPEPTNYQCPICSGPFGVTPDMEGKRIACPHCGQEVTIDSSASNTDSGTSKIQTSKTKTKHPSEELFAPGFTPTNKQPHETKRTKSPSRKTKSPRFKGQPGRPDSDQATPIPAGLPPTSVTSAKSNVLPGATTEKTDAGQKTGLPTFHQDPQNIKEPENNADESNAASPDDSSATSDPLATVLSALPMPFLVEDPQRISNLQSRKNTKVLLPDSTEGTRQLDQRLVKIQYKGETVELISRTPEEQARYRRAVNLVSMLIGMLFIIIAFVILLW